jgi:hypothetical protein
MSTARLMSLLAEAEDLDAESLAPSFSASSAASQSGTSNVVGAANGDANAAPGAVATASTTGTTGTYDDSPFTAAEIAELGFNPEDFPNNPEGVAVLTFCPCYFV